MALTVGNLLLSPSAQSFISVRDAEDYLRPEGSTPGVAAWLDADQEVKEGGLVTASRWMADMLEWHRFDLSAGELIRVGRAAARMAVVITNFDPFAPVDPNAVVKRAKSDTAEVEFFDPASIGGGDGTRWPWLGNLLRGLIASKDAPFGIGVLVV